MFEYCNNIVNNKQLSTFVLFGNCINDTIIECNQYAKHDLNFFYFENCAQFIYINYIVTSIMLFINFYTFYKLTKIYQTVYDSKPNLDLIKLMFYTNTVDLINNIIFLIIDRADAQFYLLYGIVVVLTGIIIYKFFTRLLKISDKIKNKKDAKLFNTLRNNFKFGAYTGAIPFFIMSLITYIYKYNDTQIYNTTMAIIYLYLNFISIFGVFNINSVINKINKMIYSIDHAAGSNRSSKNLGKHGEIKKSSSNDFKTKAELIMDSLTLLKKSIARYWMISSPLILLIIIGYFGFNQAPYTELNVVFMQLNTPIILSVMIGFINNSYIKMKTKTPLSSKSTNNNKNNFEIESTDNINTDVKISSAKVASISSTDIE